MTRINVYTAKENEATLLIKRCCDLNANNAAHLKLQAAVSTILLWEEMGLGVRANLSRSLFSLRARVSSVFFSIFFLLAFAVVVVSCILAFVVFVSSVMYGSVPDHGHYSHLLQPNCESFIPTPCRIIK